MDGYRALYRRTIQDQHMRALQLSTPGFYQIDDHEVTNDITNRQSSRVDTLQTGLGVWRTYMASTNPSEDAAIFGFVARSSAGEAGTYFSFAAGELSFRPDSPSKFHRVLFFILSFDRTHLVQLSVILRVQAG